MKALALLLAVAPTVAAAQAPAQGADFPGAPAVIPCETAPEGSRMEKWQSRMERFDAPRNWRIVDAIRAAAKEVDATPAQVALAWLVHQPVVSSVIWVSSGAAVVLLCAAVAAVVLVVVWGIVSSPWFEPPAVRRAA